MNCGDPGGSRTPDLEFRKLSLYPAELRDLRITSRTPYHTALSAATRCLPRFDVKSIPAILTFMAIRLNLVANVTICVLLSAATSSAWAAEPTTCQLEAGPTRAVSGVIDAETLKLDDGTEVRLLGALAPKAPDSELDTAFWPPERDAKAALEKLVLGRSVTLAYSGRRFDRYGRTRAHVFVEPLHASGAIPDGENRVWVQAHMLSQGHARAYVLKDSLGCLRELTAHEALASASRIGLWSNAAYQARDATQTQELMRLRSTFQIVEGEVSRVIQARTSLILRFVPQEKERQADEPIQDETRSPRRDFSIQIKPTISRSWQVNGLSLADLEGRRIRVRGWIERRGGPTIEILDGHQIELVEGQPVTASAVAEPPPAETVPRRRSRKRTIDVSVSASQPTSEPPAPQN